MATFYNLDIVCRIDQDRLIENITVDGYVTIRRLKELLLERFRDLKEKYSFINYGFILHQNYDVCGHFLSDNCIISSLNPENFNGLNSGLMFMFKESFRNMYHIDKICTLKKNSLTLKRYLKKKTEDENKLIHAITDSNIVAVSGILRRGIDPNFNDSIYDLPPTFHALTAKVQLQENILDLLTNNGSHIDFKSTNGFTIMHHAVILGNFTTITILTKYGVTLDDVDIKGNPAWFLAINSNVPIEFFRWLLLTEPNFGTINDDNISAFHICCRNNLPTHLEVLLNTVYNKYCVTDFTHLLNLQNQNGNTPLHYSVIYKSFDCVKILKGFKASINLKNYAGETSIQIAQRMRDFNIVSVLQLGEDGIPNYVQSSSLVTCVPTSYQSYSTTHNQIREYHHPSRTPTIVIGEDPQNIGIDFGFNHMNPFNKIDTFKFKNKTKTYVRVANQIYPPVIQAVTSHCPLFHEQLQIIPGDMIQVFILLNTGVSFGRRKSSSGFHYGWFPASCIGLDNRDVMSRFKKAYFNKDNFDLLKILSKTIYYGQIPILKEIVVSDRDFHLGLELSYKKNNFSASILDPKNPLLISPHYIKSIKENSLARDYEFRIGDRILAINDMDVTTHDHAVVSDLIKKLVNSTKKLHTTKPPGSSTLSLKWFKKRSEEPYEKQNVTLLIGRYHVPPIASQSIVHPRRAMTIRSVYTDGGNYSAEFNSHPRKTHDASAVTSHDTPNNSYDIIETLADRMNALPTINPTNLRINDILSFPSSTEESSPVVVNEHNNIHHPNDYNDDISILTPTSNDLFPEFR